MVKAFNTKHLRKLRRKARITARELSIALGVPRSTILSWEWNETIIRRTELLEALDQIFYLPEEVESDG